MTPRCLHAGASALLATLLAATTGCQETPAPQTAVVVELHSDFASEIARVDVVIRDAADRKDGSEHVFAIGPELAFPFSFVVQPSAAGADERFVVVATGSSAAGETLVQAKGDVAFARGQTLSVALWLARSCRGVACAPGMSCATAGAKQGQCGGIPRPMSSVVEGGGSKPKPMPDSGLDPGDAGSGPKRDGGMRDAAPQPAKDAATDSGGSGTGGSAGADLGTDGSTASDATVPDGTVPDTETDCADDVDNDGDGDRDCLDPDCDGRSCDDASPCTTSDSCAQRECRGGPATPDAHRWHKLADYPGVNSTPELIELGDATAVLGYLTCKPCQQHLMLLDAGGKLLVPKLDLGSAGGSLVRTSGGPANQFLLATSDGRIEVRGPELQTYREPVLVGDPAENWMRASAGSAAYDAANNRFDVAYTAYNADYSKMGMYWTTIGADGAVHAYNGRMMALDSNGYGAEAAGHADRKLVALYLLGATRIAYADGTPAKTVPVAMGDSVYGEPIVAHQRFALFELTGSRETSKVFVRTFDAKGELPRSRELPIVWPNDKNWTVWALDDGYVFRWLHATDALATNYTVRMLVTDTYLNVVGEMIEISDLPYPDLRGSTRYVYGSPIVQTAYGLAQALHVGGTAGTATEGSIQWLTMTCLPLP